jgi:hypothetical protein
MKFTKEKVLSLVKQNVNEMSMEFYSPDRPSGDIQQKLQADDTPLSKVPLPKTNVAHQNFQELLASERYQKVVEDVKKYTNFQGALRPGLDNMLPLMHMMGNAHNEIIDLESKHLVELQNLAIAIVKEEMGIGDDEIDFRAEIIAQDRFDISDFNRERGNEENPQEVNVDDEPNNGEEGIENIEPEMVDIEEELYLDLSQLNIERAKRRLINSIIQGASKRGHYMYQYFTEKIREITGSDTLVNLYGIMMSVNDVNYWQLSDDIINANADNSVGGKETADFEGEDSDREEGDDRPKVYAQALNFPILVHELIKGVLEVLAGWGQTGDYQNPQDRAMTKKVIELEDTLEKEMWDLRLGPAIWDRVRESFPEEVLTKNGKELQNYLFMNVFELPAKEFLVLMREVISNSNMGKSLLVDMLEGIKKMLKDEAYEDAMAEFNTDLSELASQTNEDSLMDELRSLGFNLPSNDEDEESDEDFLSQFK